MRGVIVVDVGKCLGCRSCEVRCAVEHSRSKTLHDAVRESPVPRPRVRVEPVDALAVPLHCRHCEDAPCVKVCPSGALEKPAAEEPVRVGSDRCVGCGWCVIACPFGVIAMDEAGRAVINCDLCLERLRRDEPPACVEGCPTGALQLKSLEEVPPAEREGYLTGIPGGSGTAARRSGRE